LSITDARDSFKPRHQYSNGNECRHQRKN